MTKKRTITLKGRDLSLEDVIGIAENQFEVELHKDSIESIKKGRNQLMKQIESEDTKHIGIYGTNRGCGNLKNNEVTPEHLKKYQVKYIKAHNCGTGNPLPENIVRAIMVIRLNSFAKGMSGMQLETCQLMIDLLNKNVTPWILEEGSVGASGDLVPLAMLGAVLIGLDDAKAYYEGKLMSAKDALGEAQLKPIILEAKEAMGLTNGSNFIASIAIIAQKKIDNIIKCASIATALSLEAIRGEKKAYGKLINEDSDRHSGQIIIAKQIRSLLKGSKRTTKEAQEHRDFVKTDVFNKDTFNSISKIIKNSTKSEKEIIKEIEGLNLTITKNEDRVQDRYSFRCAPHIHGATLEALDNLKSVLKKEINSASDNPLFDFESSTKEWNKDKTQKIDSLPYASGGNFHGQALAVPIDYMKQALTALSLTSDKRTFSLLDRNLSYGLPQDLAVEKDGININGNSGYMIAQYAGAARAAENRILSTPASVMSVATAANQEDYVSMGSIGALHLLKIIYNTEILIAIELLCATRGLQITIDNLPKELKKLGEGTQLVFDLLRDALPPYEGDNYIRTEIETILKLIKNGKVLEKSKL